MKNVNVFCIDKPKGYTSNGLIQEIKKRTNIKKIGHGGTLDPIATGVLIIGINKGTKYLNNHLHASKTYIATIEFGYSTNTYDNEGKITKTSDVIPHIDEIRLICDQLMLSDYYQEVPLYSAVKINGQELYKYARNNIEIKELPKRLVKLIDYKILSYNQKKLEIEVQVSKGFYIRSFVNDLARLTNSCATMIELRRITSGDFHITDAYTIDEFVKFYNDLNNK